MFQIILFSIIIIICSYLLFKKWNSRNINLPPGPWGLPILGNLLQLGTSPHKTLTEWKNTYGPLISVTFGSFPAVAINDYKLIKEALNNPIFSGRPDFIMCTERSGGERHGILFSDGNEWSEQRRFILRQLKDFGFGKKSMELIIQEEVNDVIEVLSQEINQPINIHARYSAAVLNSLWAFIAGERFKHDDPKLHDVLEFYDKNLTEVNALAAVSVFMPWSAKYFRKLSGHELMMRDLGASLNFIKNPIKKHIESFVHGQNRDLIDAYIEEIKNTTDSDSSFYQDIGELVMLIVCFDLFSAGAETTTTTLSWTFLYLAVNPTVQIKLQKEIDDVIGNSRRPCLEDKIKMPYLEAVILEVLRFSSLAPIGLFHRAMSDSKLGDYDIPKDTMIITNLYSCHFDEKYWGDPHVFRPERFLSPDKKYVVRHDSFLPFSYGKRICLGEGLARAELFLFTASLFQRFNVRPVEGETLSLEPIVSFVLMPKPHKLVLTERTT